ncbi:MAG: tetratricopeptide repeat protein [Dechloromonas sp.]|nr:MAG: tetratricopeptide repeat protein [Dechloromonas sp.]
MLKRHEEAMVCFDQALAIDSSNADLHFNRGKALKCIGRIEDALKYRLGASSKFGLFGEI